MVSPTKLDRGDAIATFAEENVPDSLSFSLSLFLCCVFVVAYNPQVHSLYNAKS